jgi:hypothetical protein
MIDSGEAESRAVAGAVRGAIGQARLDAGVNITGLLVDIGSAESVDYRQHFMCWQLTRVLRPSLTEKVPPAVVRSVVDQQTAPSRTVPPSHRLWRAGSPLSALSRMQMHREAAGGAAWDSDGADGFGATRKYGYVPGRAVPSGCADRINVSPCQELCRTAESACA